MVGKFTGVLEYIIYIVKLITEGVVAFVTTINYYNQYYDYYYYYYYSSYYYY